MKRWVRLAGLGICVVSALLGTMPVYATPSSQGQTVHVVVPGETLFRIARRYDTSVEAISAANGITNPARIYAGQRLIIPTTAFPSGADTSLGQAIGGSERTHLVAPGENLYRIALQYGTTVQTLAQLNGIANHHRVVVGQRLRIPGGSNPSLGGYRPVHATAAHTIRPGETLGAIAMRYGVTVWTLAQVNHIANPSLIFPGQALVIPRASSLAPTQAPASVGGGKQIVVDLSEQHLYAYQGGTLIYSFVASTGLPSSPTRTGTFRVLDKIPNAYASTWGLQMPHWLGIYWAGSTENGIHALPILSNGQRLWAGYLGSPVSYGCIVLGVQEAHLLYNWAEVGTPVLIRP